MNPLKKSLKIFLLALVMVVGLRGNGQSVPNGMELSRDTAISMAIRKNIDLRVQALSSSLAEADLTRSRSIYDPLLIASGSHGDTTYPGETFRSKTTTGSVGVTQFIPTGGSVTASTQTGYTTAFSDIPGSQTEDWQSSVGITIYQPLLKNAGKQSMELGITLAASNLEDSLAGFRFYLTDTVFSVLTAYNRLYVLRQVLKSREDALDSAQKLLEELQKKGKQGPLQRMETANAEYAITQRRRDFIDAGRNVSDQEAHLRYLIGMEEKTELIPIDPPSRAEPLETEEQAIQAAMEMRPDLKQMRLSVERNTLQEKVARRQVLPELGVTASGGFSGIDNNAGDSFARIGEGEGQWWSAGVLFSVPIGNRAAKSDYRQSKIRTEQAENQLTAFAWKIRDDVESDMRALISARLQMQMGEKSSQIAEERLEEYRKNSRTGGATVQEVLDAENDLITARNTQLEALETFAYTVALLWRDTGLLLDRQNIRIDTSHPDRVTQKNTPSAKAAVNMASEGKVPDDLGLGALGTSSSPAAKTPVVEAATGERARPSAPGASGKTQAVGNRYTLHLGNFRAKSSMTEACEKVRSAGLSPAVAQGPKREETAIRLFLADYADLRLAQKEIAKLRGARAQAFLLKNDQGGYSVFAGSFFSQEGAEEEKKRMASLGVELHLQKAHVSLPTYVLTAGAFPTREAALQQSLKLQKMGIASTIVENS